MSKKRGRPKIITDELRNEIIAYIEANPNKTMIDISLIPYIYRLNLSNLTRSLKR